jgi:hypothetical protein
LRDPRVKVVRVVQTIGAVWLCGLVIAAAGCAATTVFTTTWRNPETKPILLNGQKVIALVYSRDESARRTAEDNLAARITAMGAQGVAGWTILPTTDAQNEEKARAAIAAAKPAGVVSMEVVAQTRDQSGGNVRVGMSWSSRGSFWPHHRHAWGVAFSPPPPPRTNVVVETYVFTLEPDEIIWTGRSRTTNASDAAALFAEVADRAATEMERAGLLKGSGQ